LSASRKYATHPHLAGSSEDLEDAKVLLELFQTQFNIPVPEEEPIFPAGSHESRHATLNIPKLSSPQAWIDTYYPIMNTPLDRSLELIGDDGSIVWTADLVEDGDPRDPEAAKYRDYVPTWHGCSFGGEAEGELVYVNYGTKEDYDKLVELGVEFKGKITIARYGGIFRGLKVSTQVCAWPL
jgi:N-acetylated-alpha-linked acidic dipeptidase